MQQVKLVKNELLDRIEKIRQGQTLAQAVKKSGVKFILNVRSSKYIAAIIKLDDHGIVRETNYDKNDTWSIPRQNVQGVIDAVKGVVSKDFVDVMFVYDFEVEGDYYGHTIIFNDLNNVYIID